MIIKMVLENFKSYGGTKEIGPFHKSFSSVVGPNGSGKSNVIDAMLFVFGKRASKMRLNKASSGVSQPKCATRQPFWKFIVLELMPCIAPSVAVSCWLLMSRGRPPRNFAGCAAMTDRISGSARTRLLPLLKGAGRRSVAPRAPT